MRAVHFYFIFLSLLGVVAFTSACDDATPRQDDAVDTEVIEPLCGEAPCVDGVCCGESCVQLDTSEHCGACHVRCSAYESCVGGKCMCAVPSGTLALCGAGEVCCPGVGCLPTQSDPWNCGACGQQCQAGEKCEDGRCVCGDAVNATGPVCVDGAICCGEACAAPEDETCQCADEICGVGQKCCADACASIDVDEENCGDCGQRCGLGQRCIGGGCTCAATNANCDGDPITGCEVDIRTDVTHCGRCGHNCAAGFVCYDAQCVQSCPVTLDNCQGSCVDTQFSRHHCGNCGNACAPGEVCSQGTCALSCQEQLQNCGGTCVDTDRDRFNCGSCGQSCAAGELCWEGRCQLSCPDYLRRCGQTCVDTRVDPQHCGACGQPCPSGLLCAQGQCVQVCPSGLHPCAGGCVDLLNNPRHCGACSVGCSGGTSCIEGECVLQCPPTQLLCNGECVDPRTDRNFCGATSCATATPCGPNQGCTQGACVCLPGFLDCNQDPADGCEAHAPTDEEHCGTCNTGCLTHETCCSGRCVDRDQDPHNCGACSYLCEGSVNAGPACVQGLCALSCASGWGDCNGDVADGCEHDVSADVNNCGGCGQTCAAINGSATCGDNQCVLVCEQGFANCNNDFKDGCETNLSEDMAHCGACNAACTIPNGLGKCVAGECMVTSCDPQWYDCDLQADNGCEAPGMCPITSGPCVNCTSSYGFDYELMWLTWDCNEICNFVSGEGAWVYDARYSRTPMGCQWAATTPQWMGPEVAFTFEYNHVRQTWEVLVEHSQEPGCTWTADVNTPPVCSAVSGNFIEEVLLVPTGTDSMGCEIRMISYHDDNNDPELVEVN